MAKLELTKYSGDRLGSIFMLHLSCILYAHFYQLPIHYECLNFTDTIFMKSILKWVDDYNLTLRPPFNEAKENEYISSNNYTYNWWEVVSQTVMELKTDYVSYFRKHLLPTVRPYLDEFAIESGYTLPFDPKKTIAVHIRMDDVAIRSDYDGRICSDLYKQRIEENDRDFFKNDRWCHQMQTQIFPETLNTLIENAKLKYPTHEVVIFSSPNEKINLPYRILSTDDFAFDLYCMCNADVLILSRSSFSFMTVFFGNASQIYLPVFCMSACIGLATKYDSNKNIEFY